MTKELYRERLHAQTSHVARILAAQFLKIQQAKAENLPRDLDEPNQEESRVRGRMGIYFGRREGLDFLIPPGACFFGEPPQRYRVAVGVTPNVNMFPRLQSVLTARTLRLSLSLSLALVCRLASLPKQIRACNDPARLVPVGDYL
jgi:hypothetical protein